jgi:hypothetical protein
VEGVYVRSTQHDLEKNTKRGKVMKQPNKPHQQQPQNPNPNKWQQQPQQPHPKQPHGQPQQNPNRYEKKW